MYIEEEEHKKNTKKTQQLKKHDLTIEFDSNYSSGTSK